MKSQTSIRFSYKYLFLLFSVFRWYTFCANKTELHITYSLLLDSLQPENVTLFEKKFLQFGYQTLNVPAVAFRYICVYIIIYVYVILTINALIPYRISFFHVKVVNFPEHSAIPIQWHNYKLLDVKNSPLSLCKLRGLHTLFHWHLSYFLPIFSA